MKFSVAWSCLVAALFLFVGCSNSDPNSNNQAPLTCAAPALDCGVGQCIDTTSHPAHCGGCGLTCGVGATCQGSSCLCAPGLSPCGNSCISTASDGNNCGGCNNTCPQGTVCSNSMCQAGCGAGQEQCGNSCVSVATDVNNCGGCGLVCQVGQSCVNRACVGGPAEPNPSVSPTATGPNPSVSPTVPPTGPTATGPNPTVIPTDGPAPTGPVPTDGPGPTEPNPTEPAPTPTGESPGWYKTGSWAGCSWTGVDDKNVNSTVSPRDFVSQPNGGPYCVSGSVGAEPMYESVALLGFNVADEAGANCAALPVGQTPPPTPAVAPTGTGVAVNFVKQGSDTSFTWRVQIQGPNGATDENDRWCATITEVQGKVFVPYTSFNTKCWDGTGTNYTPGTPISAVVFLVPGSTAATPYEFCVNGFADGTSLNDAPDGSAQAGAQTGTLGNNNNKADRAKVSVGGENYIIQNNAWGNGASLVLSYENNSFTVTNAQGSGQSAPASFPSIYIGGNGFTNNDVYSTRSTDNLPRAISQIGSIPTTFRWSGNTNGSFNAAYDVWFADASRAADLAAGRRYNDGIDGFLMVWFVRPSGGQVPIGSDQADVTIAGKSWDVWVGPRGSGPSSTDGAEIASNGNAPVVSYVIKNETLNSLTFDLKDFINDALGRGLSNSMLLTDVFAGFEIWSGGNGLKVDEFTCVVNP